MARLLLIQDDMSRLHGNQTKSISVLEIPPVDSPQSAVKVAIASKAKEME